MNQGERKYYVYAHYSKDGELFYVGKGSGDRLRETGSRSLFWKNFAKKHGFVATVLCSSLTEDEAFEKEIEAISRFKSIGLCRVNVSLGGDGVRVSHRWWGPQISKGLKGRKIPCGPDNPSYKNISLFAVKYLYTVEHLSTTKIAEIFHVSTTSIWQRLRDLGVDLRPRARPAVKIRCLNDGKVFSSINDAAREYGVFRENIRKVLMGKYSHTGNLKFTYEP